MSDSKTTESVPLILTLLASFARSFFSVPDLRLVLDLRLKRLLPMRQTRVQSLGREDPLEKEMAIHSSILAWRIPWTEKPSRLQSTGSQRVRHDWATSPPYLTLSTEVPLIKAMVFPAIMYGCESWTIRIDAFELWCWRRLLRVPWAARRLNQSVLKEGEGEVAQSCPNLCDPVDCSLPDSSVQGILEARILEWVAISFSRRASWPRDRT